MLCGNIIDQLHHVDGFAHAGSAKQADLAALGKRTDQINHLDARLQQLVGCRKLLVSGRRAVNRRTLLLSNGSLFINRVTQHIHNPAQSLYSNRHRYRCAGVFNAKTAADAFRGPHCDGTHHTISQLLLYLKSQTLFGD